MAPEEVAALVREGMRNLVDPRVLTQVSSLLVKHPRRIILEWPYGSPGEQFPAFLVLDHATSGTGIVYCQHGFGPRNPWGLIFTNRGSPFYTGPDECWFPRFLDAYFESKAPNELDIWRVWKGDSWKGQETEWLTDDLPWHEAWHRIMDLRQSDPGTWYGCGHALRD